MNVIIDANIFKGYCRESIIGLEHKLTSSPSYLFQEEEYVMYIDDGDQMQYEYKAVDNPQVVEEMIIELLNSGKMRLTKTKIDPDFERILRSKGFDMNSRDKWYIRAALVAKEKSDTRTIYLITEDIDFFDPRKKNCSSKTRNITIRNKRSPVAHELIDRKKIKPICVENHVRQAY
ncbi:hypothetical protein SANA_25340 [Gottschalkiaceae bacterium SANA]|nr:hypothetical protein SANA_25340 [Gottschalkiaceae bacterium SANA]